MSEISRYKKLVISDIRAVTNDVKLFSFEPHSTKDLHFKAGQYLTFIFGEARRSYSIASSPLLAEPVAIGVKRIENGTISRRLFDETKVGDELFSTGAAGVFTLPNEVKPVRQIFFFAAGSGIIPIFSLIKTVLYSTRHVSLILIYSNRSERHTIFLEELQVLQQHFPESLHVEFLFSNSEDLFRARLHGDLLNLFLKTLARDDLNKCLYYMCGPEAYMRFCTFVLHSHQIDPKNIRKEIFNTTTPSIRIEPPDKLPHQVKIHFAGDVYDIEVKFPVTILQSARNHGVDIPFSCEVGRCGNCVAKCLGGKVWMSYNEVLTEADLKTGMILTCTAFPIGGNVTIVV